MAISSVSMRPKPSSPIPAPTSAGIQSQRLGETTAGRHRRSKSAEPAAGAATTPDTPDILETPDDADVSGSGLHFLWSILPSILTGSGSILLVSVSVRVLGASLYGLAITISTIGGLLGIAAGALRFTVVHTRSRSVGATRRQRPAPSRPRPPDPLIDLQGVFTSLALAVVAASFIVGWFLPRFVGIHTHDFRDAYVTVVLSMAGTAAVLATGVFTGVLTAHRRYLALSIVGSVGFLIQVVVTLALVHGLGILAVGLGTAASGVTQAFAVHRMAHRDCPAVRILRMRFRWRTVKPLVRFALGVAALSATSTLISTSDVFVINSVRDSAAVTTFQIGSTTPTTLSSLLMLAFGVLFPGLVAGSRRAQERAIEWVGKVIGCLTGAAFGALVAISPQVLFVLAGAHNSQEQLVLMLTSTALLVDVCYHGVVQVVFARGEQRIFVQVAPIELACNLAVTIVAVLIWGPVGSGVALLSTVLLMDVIIFPVIMRGKWGSGAGRFVLRNGLWQALVTAAVVVVGSDLTNEYFGSPPVVAVCVAAMFTLATLCGAYVCAPRDLRTKVTSLFTPRASSSERIRRVGPTHA